MKKLSMLFVLGVLALSFVQQATQLLVPGKGIEGYVTVGASTSTEIKTKFGEGYKEINHYSDMNGTKTLFSVERRYARQGVAFYFKPDSDTVFCVKVKAPYSAKTEKGIVLGTSTMQQVRDAYGAADFYEDGANMFLEYPGIKFYTPAAATQAEALKQKVTVISITEF